MRCWDPTKYNIYIRYIYPIRLNYDRTFLSGVPDCALIAIASLSLDRAGLCLYDLACMLTSGERFASIST